MTLTARRRDAVFRTFRTFVVTSLTIALISLSCGDAFAGEPDTVTSEPTAAAALGNGKIWR